MGNREVTVLIISYVCNFECLLMILTDSAGEFRRFQGSANISIYQLLEMELLRVGNREVGIRELTSTAPFSSHWSWQQ